MTSGGRKRSVAGPVAFSTMRCVERLAHDLGGAARSRQVGAEHQTPAAHVGEPAVAAQSSSPTRRRSPSTRTREQRRRRRARRASRAPPRRPAGRRRRWCRGRRAASTSAASPPATQAPIGRPLASDLAAVKTSGRTPASARTPTACRCAPCRTGSRRRSAARRHGRRPRAPPSASRSEIGQTPHSPWTGSIITAAVRRRPPPRARSGRCAARPRSRARAARTAPASSRCGVADSAPIVRP